MPSKTIKQFVNDTGFDKYTFVMGSTSFDMDENGLWLNGSNRQDTQGYWSRFPAEFYIQCFNIDGKIIEQLVTLDELAKVVIINNQNEEKVLILNNPQVICWKSNKN
jgi:hypothetical protein